MAISKVIYGGNTLIDLTGDTVTKDKLLKGYTAHGADGEVINGACEFDANTQDATASAAEILKGKTAYNKGSKVTGTMTNNGAVTGYIHTIHDPFIIPMGWHDGSGTVGIAPEELAKIISENIRQNVTFLGVTGGMSSTEGANPQAKTVTPTTAVQIILPDAESGYNFLSQVTVAPIPYVETENSAGGITVTIG